MINKKLLGVGIVSGVLMGLMTSLVGFVPQAEFIIWLAYFLLWVVLAVRAPKGKPLLSVLGCSVLAGISVGIVQVVLFSHYLANNPAYSGEIASQDLLTRIASFVGFGLGAGTAGGLLLLGVTFLALKVLVLLEARNNRANR
ncbi:MAG: hypothetical protein K0U36_01110 [Alphaproteobacteria bacterium]|nr:hypothetical protein [Alphaproteobacteria bacterium]